MDSDSSLELSQGVKGVQGNHLLLVGGDDPDPDSTVRGTDAGITIAIGHCIQFDSQPGGLRTDIRRAPPDHARQSRP